MLPIYLCILLIAKGCTSTPSSEYVAAVVEYYPVQDPNLSPEARLQENVNGYLQILKEIKQKLDIVVFPESTLYMNAKVTSRLDCLPYAVEVETDGASLCPEDGQDQSTFLTKLACAAKTYQTYLVVNLLEKSPCSDCSEDGWSLYNTNVVFDRKGVVIAKYRKFNLFGEYFLNQTAQADLTIFETDFGVKFGTFTCFDLLFRRPALQLAKEHGISHFIFPTMWFSELPFLTALQAQQQWVQELDAVFLAAGANNPKVGSGGSGIFQGKHGPLIFDIIGNGGSKAYVASVPKDVSKVVTRTTSVADSDNTDRLAKTMDGFYLKKDDLTQYTSVLITPGQKRVEQILYSGDDLNKLHCHFDIEMQWNQEILNHKNSRHYQYRLVAYSGVRSFSGVYNGGVEICGIVPCVNNALDSCATRFSNYDDVSWPVTFKKMSVKANFTLEDNRIQHPNSLLSSIRPLPADSVGWTHNYFVEEGVVERTYHLKEPQNRLMTFAIYGRDFNRDSEP